ncbi:hypothetical protein CCACVL1_29006 [Corchorus capsularis]|uniref:Uncharacterized protein n=1 Tax=Corchorus capsularis TaxID=210143 RepID=A0A1R3G4C1_COCAP|nr:hypothetical protein CCACVL1_29006 [Corchorus capsularis]
MAAAATVFGLEICYFTALQ